MSGRPLEREDPFQDEVTARYEASDVARLSSQYPSPQLAPTTFPRSTPAPPSEEHRRVESGVTPVRKIGSTAPAVPMHILRQLVACYAEFLGLAARPIVIEQMREMGLTPATITTNELQRLVIDLAQRLDTARAEREFYESVRGVHPMLTHL